MTKPEYGILNLTQGTPEWLEVRRKHATASDAPVITDIDPYRTKLELFEEKAYGITKAVSSDKQALFSRGHEVEAMGRDYFRDRLGLLLTPAVLVSTRTPDVMASLDGFNPEKRILFESKFVGRDALSKIKSEKQPPAHHACQMQVQLYVTGFDKALYFAADPEGNAAVLEVVPDGTYQQDIIRDSVAFMDLVRAGRSPDPGPRDYVVLDDPRFRILATLKEQADAASAAFEEFKETLLAEHTAYRRIKSGGLRITRSTVRGAVEYGRIPQLKGVDLERYRKPTYEKCSVSFDKKGDGK